MAKIYRGGRTHTLPPSSRSFYAGGGFVCATQRAPTDAFFYGELTLQNVAAGSQYWVAQSSNLSNVVANAAAPGGDIVISGIGALANPMLLTIRVRKGTSGTKYAPFSTQAYLVKTGASAFVSQQIDPVA